LDKGMYGPWGNYQVLLNVILIHFV
jgi:hypothetical protein